MSYILDTLKKLEKEKSKINNKLDIKKLILKDTDETNRIKILKKRSHLLTVLILGISIFFFLNFSVFKFPMPSSNLPPGSKKLSEKKDLRQIQKNSANNLSFPLEAPDKVKTSQNFEQAPEKKNNVLKAVNTPDEQGKRSELVSKKSKPKKEANGDTKTLPSSHNFPDKDMNRRADYIEQPVREKHMPDELNKYADKEKKNEKPTHSLPSRIISRGALPQNIIDIKISGIVFFGEGVPLNYAIAGYKGENQIKVKEGDQLDGVKILEIRSEKILLMFQNKIFEKKLGS